MDGGVEVGKGIGSSDSEDGRNGGRRRRRGRRGGKGRTRQETKAPEVTRRPRPASTPARQRRKERLKELGVYGPHHLWIKKLPCIIARHPLHQCRGANTGHHRVPICEGGLDEGNEVPMCEGAHAEVEEDGNEAFEAKYDVDLEAIAHQATEMRRQELLERRRLNRMTQHALVF